MVFFTSCASLLSPKIILCPEELWSSPELFSAKDDITYNVS